MVELHPPSAVRPFLAAPETLLQTQKILARGAFEGGFLLVGPQGQGKTTLAYLLAATILSGGKKLGEVKPGVRNLIAAGAHPDLLLLRREENPKTGKLTREIGVEQARGIIGRLHRTATGDARVVIIDLADDLNSAAANSLLKALEEPPAGTALLLLSLSTSRLLPTLVSRCRKIALRPVRDDALASFLEELGETSARAAAIAAQARGAPGAALRLAASQGDEPFDRAESYMNALRDGGDLLAAARGLSAKLSEPEAEEARGHVLRALQQNALEHALGEGGERHLAARDAVQTAFANMGTADAVQTALIAGLRARKALHERQR